MTIDISNNASRISYTVAQGATQQAFAVPFEFFEDSDISVYVDGTLKVITTDYAISGGNGSTGTVTFNTAGEGETQQVLGATGGSTVTIVRFTTIERTTDFTTGADINRAALNTQLDTLTAIAADNKDRTDRALHISNTEIAPSLELPSIDARKGRVLDFHETSGAVQAGPLSNDIATIANNITEILAADSEAAAAAASATAASASASTATTKAVEASNSATYALESRNAANVSRGLASTSAFNARLSELDAEAARDAAEAVDVITNATATTTTLSAGSPATVSVTATNGTGAFAFGIPTGPTGPAGAAGAAGAAAPVLTASEIKTSYESNSNTNAYTDAEKAKITNVEALADVTDTANVVAALTAGTNVSIAVDGTISSTDTNTTYSVGDGGLTTNDFTNADHTKLDGIEAGATADQTAAQIKTAYESNADTNEFSDAEQTKLAGIETSATADQTASEIRALVESATDSNVFTDSDHTKLNGIETGATADQTGLQIKNRYEGEADTNAFTDAEKTKLTALDITAEENQNAYASLAILNASGSNIYGTHALNKQQQLTLQEGIGVSITKINTQQFQISTSSSDLYSANESTPLAQPSATGANAIAIGESSVASGDDSIALVRSVASGFDSFASGISRASGSKAIAMGVGTLNTGYGALQNGSIAIGGLAKANYAYSVALGSHAVTTANHEIALGNYLASVRIADAYNLPSADGTSGQVLTTDGSGAVTFSTLSGTGDLLAANNLSDLANAATARTNLGLGTAAITASTAYATAAQGTTADAALPKAGGALTGPVTTSSTFDGRDVSVDGQKLDGIAVGATSYTDADVDTHLNTSTATTGEVLSWSGTDYDWIAAGGGGGADLYAANESSPTAQPSATGTNAIAIGDSAVSTGSRTVAFSNSRAGGWDSIAGAILNNTTTYGTTSEGNIAFGEKAKVTGSASQSIGKLSLSSGAQSMSLGYDAQSSGLRTYAFGYGSTASHTDSVAIGRSVSTTASNQVALGGSTQTVRISESYTLPTADGTANQVLTTDGAGVVTFATAGGGAALELYDENPSTPTANTVTGANSSAIGSNVTVSGDNSFAAGVGATATAYSSFAFGDGADATGSHSVAIGGGAIQASGAQSIAIGYGSDATNADAHAFGRNAQATGSSSTALGRDAVATSLRSMALGDSYASGTDAFSAAIANNASSYGATNTSSIAIGKQAKATGAYGTAIGEATQATASNSVCMGYYSQATGQGSLAFGYDTQATGLQSTAIGLAARNPINGSFKFAGGKHQTSGDSQTGIFPLLAETTDATATAMVTYHNNSATASTDNQVVLPNNSVYGFTGTIIARENSAQTNDFAVWEVKGGAVRATGVATTALGSYNINKISESTGAATWAIAISADTTNGAIAFTVTGEAAHSIRWFGTINTTEVTY